MNVCASLCLQGQPVHSVCALCSHMCLNVCVRERESERSCVNSCSELRRTTTWPPRFMKGQSLFLPEHHIMACQRLEQTSDLLPMTCVTNYVRRITVSLSGVVLGPPTAFLVSPSFFMLSFFKKKKEKQKSFAVNLANDGFS